MPRISVARTTSHKLIFIESEARHEADILDIFRNFSAREKFEALLAIDYLILCEERGTLFDKIWWRSLTLARTHLEGSLSSQTIDSLKIVLGIATAFAARDYGKALVHPHFRRL